MAWNLPTGDGRLIVNLNLPSPSDFNGTVAHDGTKYDHVFGIWADHSKVDSRHQDAFSLMSHTTREPQGVYFDDWSSH